MKNGVLLCWHRCERCFAKVIVAEHESVVGIVCELSTKHPCQMSGYQMGMLACQFSISGMKI